MSRSILGHWQVRVCAEKLFFALPLFTRYTKTIGLLILPMTNEECVLYMYFLCDWKYSFYRFFIFTKHLPQPNEQLYCEYIFFLNL